MQLRALWNRAFKKQRQPEAPLAPQEPICVIGDIHGRMDCLQRLLKKLETAAPQARHIFVGDYIDRGECSADVLQYLMAQSKSGSPSVFLRGNHEEMFLRFIQHPQEDGNRWMRHGGLQTMASFGIGGLRETNDHSTLAEARDTLLEVLDPALIPWLQSLPRWWQTGNIAVVHAAADPHLAMNDQLDNTLTWGNSDFGSTHREDGLWIAHGHTIVDAPMKKNGVISVDTGAYATGRLTSAVIKAGTLTFVQS